MIEGRADCLVIGGGISGLMAATVLDRAGMRVCVVDKGRGIGGRLATVRGEDNGSSYAYDFGAQYFTTRDERFGRFVDEWLEAGIVDEWSTGFVTEDGIVKEDGEPRYTGRRGIRAIAEHLAAGLDVQTGQRVTHIEWAGRRWAAITDQGTDFEADRLVVTPPIPQTLELLDDSGIQPSVTVLDALKSVRYSRCITAMLRLAGPTKIPAPGGVWLDEPVMWLADNRVKGISNGANTVTVHGGPEFSEIHWGEPDDELAQKLTAFVWLWLGSDVIDVHLHRWRYSQATTIYGDPFAAIDAPGPMVLAGDGFGGARVEGAALSGIAAAEYLVRMG